jgi:hypothetical protein
MIDVIFSITKQDLKVGIATNPFRCPVARGMRRQLARGVDIAVIGDRVALTMTPPWIQIGINTRRTSEIKFPPAVQAILREIDSGDVIRRYGVKPFKFQMKIPKRFVEGRRKHG